ncbi:MAG: O-antigen ligase family protein [Clostridia bacterium]|nr:O-antigen ligase family protein [Clostridia bacterium]
MTKKLKIKDFFISLKNQLINLKTNQTVLVCMLFAVVYLISGYYKWVEILASLCALIFMAILPSQKGFCIFMFVHSFTLSNIGYDSCFMVTQLGFCLILLVRYIKGVKTGRYKFYNKIVSVISLFLAIWTFISIFHPFYRGAWLYFGFVALFYLIFAMRKDFDITQGMNFMFGGLLTSCGLAVVSLILPLFQYEVITDGRFRAFINNTNYLYMRAMFVLAYYMYRYLLNKLSHFGFAIIYLILAIITLSTLSKTGIVMLILFTLIFFVLFLKQDFKKRIKFVGILLLVALALCLICYKFILVVWDRFAQSFTSDNFLSSLLTGRDLIWKMYLEEIFKNPFYALFGHGLLTEQVFIASIFGPTETHNFYIFLLYRFGIVGTIFLGYIVHLFIKELGYDKPKLIAWLPLLFILIESLCDNTFRCYNISYFLCGIMILFSEFKAPVVPQEKEISTEASIQETKD